MGENKGRKNMVYNVGGQRGSSIDLYDITANLESTLTFPSITESWEAPVENRFLLLVMGI